MRINIPPVTRALLLLTFTLSFLYAILRFNIPSETNNDSHDFPDRSVPYLTLIPSKSIYNPWTILTSTFVEQNVINFLINTAAIYFGGRYLERAWGSKDFAITMLIASAIPNLLVIPTYVFWGILMRNTTRADTPISGAITLQAAFLVAFKQLVPEHTVSLYKGLVKIRVKHFPAIFLLLNTFGGIILGTDTALLLAWYGLFTTWLYLRFYKYQPELSGLQPGETKIIGDASETFAFATFFPNVVQPPIATVCDQLYILFCNMKLIKPFSDEAISSGNEQAASRIEGGLPIHSTQTRTARAMNKREEAERRRMLALKALDERLNAANTSAKPVLPSTSMAVEAPNQTEQSSLS